MRFPRSWKRIYIELIIWARQLYKEYRNSFKGLEVQLYDVNKTTQKAEIEVEGADKQSFEVLGVIDSHMKIRSDDKLVLLGKQEDIDKLLETN